MRLRISRYIFILQISILCWGALGCLQGVSAQNQQAKEAVDALTDKPAPVFAGVAVSVDLVGVAMKAMGSNFAQMEVAARLNFKEKFFPIFELGYGESDFESEETGNVYRTKAPYFRIGMDYNFTKNWRSGNRMFAGVRYAFSSFAYDLCVPGFTDPVWNVPVAFDYRNLGGNYHWGEVVFGIETKIWSFIRLGWDARYKYRFKGNDSRYGTPWYVPGFGKNDTSGLGGTFKVIFDI